ncbi:ARPP-1 family domain-containing protein [Flavitalea flava]
MISICRGARCSRFLLMARLRAGKSTNGYDFGVRNGNFKTIDQTVKFLFSFLCVISLLPASAQLTYQTLTVDYDSAWQYKNLKIIPIRMKGGGGIPGGGVPGNPVTLKDALNQGLVTVSERGSTSFDNVHWLRFNTHSEKSILIGGGEIIAGGRQDRMVIRDTILEPSSKDQYVPVMCVEEGRWSEKEKKFAYSNYANPHLRKVLDSTRNQVLIWKEIEKQLAAGAYKNTTEAYLSRNLDKKHMEADGEYFRFFQQKFRNSDSTIVGFVAVSGYKVIGSDIFAGTGLFYPQLEPLLHSYIDDALLFGGPVSLPDPPLHRYMDSLLKNEPSQEEFARKNGRIFRQKGQVVHVHTFLKESAKKETP